MIKNDDWVKQFVMQEEAAYGEAEIRGGFNKAKASDRTKYGEANPKDVGAAATKQAEKKLADSGKEIEAIRVGKPYKAADGTDHVIFKVSRSVGKAGNKTITVHVPMELDGKKLSTRAIKLLAMNVADNKIQGMMKKLTQGQIQEDALIAEAKKKETEAEGSEEDDAEDAAEDKGDGDVDPEDLDLDALDSATKMDLIDRIMQSLQDNCEDKEYQKCFDKVSDMMDGYMPETSEEPAADEEPEE